MEKSELKFEITKHIAVLGASRGGWSTELNLVSWNDREPKFDIRSWDPEHHKMGKGITLTSDEARLLGEALQHYFQQQD